MIPDSRFNNRRKPWKAQLTIVLLAGTVILIGTWAAYKLVYSPLTRSLVTQSSLRTRFESKYRNVQPQVRYVGDEVCIRCHREMAESYGKHPMAHSLAPVAQADPVERYGADAHIPFDAQGFRYEINRLGGRMFHAEKRINSKGQVAAELQAEVQYALGSGSRGRSYLLERDGFLFQSPVSWYAGAQGWDLAAGYRMRNQHFARPIAADCLYCHANRVEAIEDSLNHFRTPIFRGYAIGCERCHGPGELHVQLRENNKSFTGEDDTIVVPDQLEPELRESVCQQCHLQAVMKIVKRDRRREDYRPGLPLQAFVSFFVLPPNHADMKRAVGQVEQMYASLCFQESKAKGAPLGCLSCHDPHDYPSPAKRLKYYRDRCLTCHREMDCALEASVRHQQNPGDNCIDCHMPRVASTDIAHTSVTDHRIVRFANQEGSEGRGARDKGRGLDLSFSRSEYPLVPFFPDEGESSGPEKQRDLGLALVKSAVTRRSPQLGQLALPLLDASLRRWPDDVPTLEAKGYALSLQGNHEEALDAFREALRLAPDREWSLFGAGQSASQLGRREMALTFWKRAVALNPWDWQYHNELAKSLAAGQEWSAAVEQCRQTLQLDIANLETRKLLVSCLLQLGHKSKAEEEFQTLLGFEPPDADELRRWFAKEGR